MLIDSSETRSAYPTKYLNSVRIIDSSWSSARGKFSDTRATPGQQLQTSRLLVEIALCDWTRPAYGTYLVSISVRTEVMSYVWCCDPDGLLPRGPAFAEKNHRSTATMPWRLRIIVSQSIPDCLLQRRSRAELFPAGAGNYARLQKEIQLRRSANPRPHAQLRLPPNITHNSVRGVFFSGRSKELLQ
ncbi:hypothetical protein BV25DRAFT_1334253 [Artomyces pyxidatus]|uniref:Uncharacterized protein n=1 Tax=Artomyces pyxidatus TaxID=48021 RepID=A0ACB8SMZ4_9AGAM|nr:hypothetical protein BV25DRAFT_1334253 [Artomyces pyxidatus]